LSDCCTPKGYRRIFSEKNAQAEARNYRRKGLDATAQGIVKLLHDRGIEGKSVLEVGGGIGAIQIELLKAGAARAVSVELTPTYEAAAGELVKEAGLGDRVERLLMDFAASGQEVEPADIVVLNRVICCYPDMPRLAGMAADHTRNVLVMTFPNDSLWIRWGLTLANLAFRVMRMEFQIFVHSPRQIVATGEQHGLRQTVNRPGFLWRMVALERFQTVTVAGTWEASVQPSAVNIARSRGDQAV
jgi:hypothetical protein